MTKEAATVWLTAQDATITVLQGLREWASTMLEGSERDEVLHHTAKMTKRFTKMQLAIADYEGIDINGENGTEVREG